MDEFDQAETGGETDDRSEILADFSQYHARALFEARDGELGLVPLAIQRISDRCLL